MKKILVLVLALTMVLMLCACGTTDEPQTETPNTEVQHEHQFGAEWATDDTHHWHVCAGEECGEIADKAEHTGGIATETEKAKCDVCGAEYGTLLDHTHSFGEWETQTPANCVDAEVEIRYCACGESETRTGDAALGHTYDQQIATEEYLATANCGEQATYYYSCACGAAGTETFANGEVLAHNYDAVVTEPTCTDDGYTTYTCSCGDTYVDNRVASNGHNMQLTSDATHHWTECACGEVTERVAHSATTISAAYNKASAMQYDVVTAADFDVTATCDCGHAYAVTEGVTVENGTLAMGANTVTVKVGETATTVAIEAVKFNVVVNAAIKDDTYINSASGSQEKTYGDNEELSVNGTSFRVFFRYNFSDVLTSSYYENYKEEAKVQFTFTVTTGSVALSDAITFKAYPVTEDRTNAVLSNLTWKNYNTESLALGWGNAYGFIEKVGNSDKVTVDGNKVTITVAYRELEEFIDDNGDVIIVFAIWKSSTKIGSIDNATEANRPTVQVVFNEDHIHVFNKEVVRPEYAATNATCTTKPTCYKSCSCGAVGTETFEYGQMLVHNMSGWQIVTDATCTDDGQQKRVCLECGYEVTESIPATSHSYDAVVTDPTCTEAGFTTHTCSKCGDSYTDSPVDANGHTYGNWESDASYHWKACACGDIVEKNTHSGGTPTETEQATCETCGVKYGGLASHVHSYSEEVTAPTCTVDGFTTYTCTCGDVYTGAVVAATGHKYGEWQTRTPANCEDAEVEFRVCACGTEETQTGDAALGHDMQTNYDANNHWTKCSRCDEATDPVAHFGGEATLTEQAICEGCGQPYGALKEPEKVEYTINGSIIEDTDINSSTKDRDRSENAQIYLYSSATRGVIFVNLKDIIDSEDFETFKTSGKFYLTFTIAGNESDVNNTKFLLQVANTTYTDLNGATQYTAGIPASAITWNSIHVSSGAYYNALAIANMDYLVGNSSGGKTLAQTDKVIYTPGEGGAAGTISYELTYDEIKDYICMDQASEYYGHIVFKFRANGSATSASKTLYYASSETATPPTVKFVYEK